MLCDAPNSLGPSANSSELARALDPVMGEPFCDGRPSENVPGDDSVDSGGPHTIATEPSKLLDLKVFPKMVD